MLARHAAVRWCAVVGGQANSRKLVVYVLPEVDMQPRSEDLRGFLKTLLPEHMVPADFVSIEQVPLSDNGKSDLAVLPPLVTVTPLKRSAFWAPTTSMPLPIRLVVASCPPTMVMLTLLRHPDQLAELREQPALIGSAVEELLRYESPSQHTARLAPDDVMLGDKRLRRRDGVIVVMAAGNRDPARFPDPDRLDLRRGDNRHLAFGWAAHFCFGAPLARIEGKIAFATLLRRLPGLALEPGRLKWRANLGLRGLVRLPVSFAPSIAAAGGAPVTAASVP